MKVLSNLDLQQNQLLNPVAQQLGSDPGSPVEGQFWYNTTSHVYKWRRNADTVVLGTLDQISAPAADVSLNSHKITSLTDPTSAQDAATKQYVDGLIQGIAWKKPVRAATTTNGTLASAFANGSAIDGVTLATADRILLKDQTAGAENGIYTVNASGAPTRATDADIAAEVLNAAVYVEEGTANADTAFVCTNDAPITLGTTALVFTAFSSNAVLAGTGLTKTGATISLTSPVLASLGGTGVVSPTIHTILIAQGASAMASIGPGTQYQTVRSGGAGADPSFDALHLDQAAAITGNLPVANGGTGANTASGARANLGTSGKFAASVGDGAATSYAVNHALGTTDVVVSVHRVASPFDMVEVDVQVTDSNNVTLLFAAAPSTNQYRVVVVG